MHPRLIETPVFTLYTFGLLLASAYGASLWWLMREGGREKLDTEALGTLGFWAIAGAIVGAKGLMVLRDASQYAANPSELFSRSLLASAGDFYGGFIGALIASAFFFWRHPRLPFWPIADLCGPAIALGQAIGRIGCFMAGDDYGRPTGLPWAVTFTDPDAAAIGGAPLGVPIHPVQLYESVVCAVLFVFLGTPGAAEAIRRSGDTGLYAAVCRRSFRARVLPRRCRPRVRVRWCAVDVAADCGNSRSHRGHPVGPSS